MAILLYFETTRNPRMVDKTQSGISLYTNLRGEQSVRKLVSQVWESRNTETQE